MLKVTTGLACTLGLAGFAAFTVSGVAMARSIECNKNQTKCVTESTQLSIGDKVGVFTEENELVATGEISAMRGERRAVLIEQRHGTIRKGYNLALLSHPGEETTETQYKLYREPAQMAVGASLGYSTISIGDGSPATEFSAFGQWRKWGGMQIIGRAVYTAMEGQVTHNDALGYEHLPISVTEVGLLGGAGYVLRENKPVSFRGEVAVGGMYVDANVDGDPSLVDDPSTNSHIKNGMLPAARWSLGAMMNFSSWHVHADFAQSLVQQAFANTLALGASKDLK